MASKPERKKPTHEREPAKLMRSGGAGLVLIPVLLALLLHVNALQNGFGWDDETIVRGISRQTTPWSIFFPHREENTEIKANEPYYRPMVTLSYYLDDKIWGDSAFGFHLSVWLLHGVNTLLVFFLARRWMSPGRTHGSAPTTSDFRLTTYGLVPLLASLLFAVHPIHAPSVAWIAGRNDTLCAAFLLTSLVLYTFSPRLIFHALSMLAFFFALLTKEAAVFAFVLFPLYDYLVSGDPPGRPYPSHLTSYIFRAIPPLLILGLYFAIRAARISLPAGGASADTLTSADSFETALAAAGLYFKLLVFPYPHHPFIGTIPVSLSILIVSAFILILTMAGWGIALFHKNRLAGMALGLMLLTLAPGILVAVLRVASTPAAERYLYLPSAGFVILVAWAAVTGWNRLSTDGGQRALRFGGMAAVAVLLLLGGWRSWKRTLVWHDQITFWEAAVAASPNSGFPYRELGKHYGGGKNFKKTEANYLQALAVDEKFLGPEDRFTARDLHLLGTLYYDQGENDKAEPFFKRALAIREKLVPANHPRVGDTLNNLALLYYKEKRYDEAEPLFRRAIAIYEQSPVANAEKLADSLNNLAAMYYAQRKLEAAEPLYKRSMEIKEKRFGPESPQMAAGFNNLAALYFELKRYDESDKLFHRALEIKEKRLNPDHPDLAPTLNNLASIAMLEGKYSDSEALFKRTIRIREKAFGADNLALAGTLENYALLLRKMKRTEEADQITARARAIREGKASGRQ